MATRLPPGARKPPGVRKPPGARPPPGARKPPGARLPPTSRATTTTPLSRATKTRPPKSLVPRSSSNTSSNSPRNSSDIKVKPITLKSTTTTTTMSRSTTEIVLEGDLRFADCLTHDFAEVSRQVSCGSHTLDRMHTFIKKVAECQQRYAKTIQKFVKEEETRNKKHGVDSMPLCNIAWNTMLQYFGSVAERQNQHSKEIATVADTLKESFKNSEVDRKKILKNERKWAEEMKTIAVATTKKRADCEAIKLNFYKEHERKTTEKIKKPDTPSSKRNKSRANFKMLKKKPKSLESIQNKLIDATNNYKELIDKANGRLKIYWDENLTQVFTSFETLEKKRVDTMNKQITILCQSEEKTYTENAKFLAELQQGTPIDVSADLESYTKQRVDIVGMPLRPLPYIYQFPFDPEEIKAGKMLTPDSNFYCTLRRLMERQQAVTPETNANLELAMQMKAPEGGIDIKDRTYHLKTYSACFIASDLVTWLMEHDIVKTREEGTKIGQQLINQRICCHSADKDVFQDGNFFYSFNHDLRVRHESTAALTVPVIFKELCAHIKRLGGYETEGIFRIPVETGILNEHKANMEKGDFSLQGETNPHAAACMLKMWLRLLAEPLIPDELFDQAIAIGMKKEEQGQNKKQDHKEVLKLFKNMDIHHRNLITQLAQLSVEISDNEKQTRMTLLNLGVIFAPAFLQDKSVDPIVVMANAKHQANFTAAMFEALAWAFRTGTSF